MPKTAPHPQPPTPPARRSLGLIFAPVAIFAAVAAMFAFALQKGDPSKLPSALIGKPAPAVALEPIGELTNERGQPLAVFARDSLARGQPTVVNFWASWCAPCVEEHPHLIRLARELGATVYGINYKDNAANARRFLNRYGNPFAAVGADTSGRAGIEWGVYGMPETFVVDGHGMIVYKHVGPITAETLTTRLVPALEAAKAKR